MTTRLERGLQILSLLESEGSYNAHQLASKMGVTRRTIFRDIALLRQLGWPVHFDADSSAYTLHSAEHRSSEPEEPALPREFLSSTEQRKVGEEAMSWDETVEAVARAVRAGQPVVLSKTSPRDGDDSVVMHPIELIFSAAGWSVTGRDLASPDASRWVSVELAAYPSVVPWHGAEAATERPWRDVQPAGRSGGQDPSAEDAG